MNGPQHDPRGPFTVEIADRAHPVTQGLNDFETNDELYTCLVGDAPIHLLAHAKSKVDGKHHPMAFVRDYGKGRVFLTTLGHDVQAFTNSSVPDLMRRGCAWAAGLTPVPSPAAPAEPKKSAAAPDAPEPVGHVEVLDRLGESHDLVAGLAGAPEHVLRQGRWRLPRPRSSQAPRLYGLSVCH